MLTTNLILLRFFYLKLVWKVIFGNSSAQGWVCILNNVDEICHFIKILLLISLCANYVYENNERANVIQAVEPYQTKHKNATIIRFRRISKDYIV